MESVFLEVAESPNCGYMPLQVYEAHYAPVPVGRVRLAELGYPHGEYEVTGWSSAGGGTPCAAMYVPVSDSGQAVVHLVYGGDWGIRLRRAGAAERWSAESAAQFGEPYLMLTDERDVLLGETPR